MLHQQTLPRQMVTSGSACSNEGVGGWAHGNCGHRWERSLPSCPGSTSGTWKTKARAGCWTVLRCFSSEDYFYSQVARLAHTSSVVSRLSATQVASAAPQQRGHHRRNCVDWHWT